MKLMLTFVLAVLSCLSLQCSASPAPTPMDPMHFPYEALPSSPSGGSSSSPKGRATSAKQAIKGHPEMMAKGSRLVHAFGNDHIETMTHAIDLRKNNRPIFHELSHQWPFYDNSAYFDKVRHMASTYQHEVPRMLEEAKNHRDALQTTKKEKMKGEAAKLYTSLKDIDAWMQTPYPQDIKAKEKIEEMYRAGSAPPGRGKESETIKKMQTHITNVKDMLEKLPLVQQQEKKSNSVLSFFRGKGKGESSA